MRIAFTHNLRLTDSEEEAEFDTAETVHAIARRSRAGGHEVETDRGLGPRLAPRARLEASARTSSSTPPRARRGRTREAFYPALFEELGFRTRAPTPTSSRSRSTSG